MSAVSRAVRVSVAVLVALLSGACGPRDIEVRPPEVRTVPAQVVEVIDGDTVRLELEGREETVRLIGIDTPEVRGSFTEEECFGLQASAFTRDRLEGQDVDLELDVERRDRYGRLLAYVWVGADLFNADLVRGGFATTLTIPPNVRYADAFVLAQRGARADGAGLWGACPSR